MTFKAIETDARSRQRSGQEHVLEAETRQAAIDALLERLGISADAVQVDPSRTVVRFGESLWTLVAVRRAEHTVSSSLRRAGAKHKRVR